MADIETRIIEVDDMLLRPGTYFNPQTEIVVVVDDSTSIDQEVFNMEAYEGADWVRISDEVPVDEDSRDRVLESFQTSYHPGSAGSVSETALEQGDDELDGDEDGHQVSLADLEGETVVLYFYPRADTPGCTTQACGVRDRDADYRAAGAR